MKSTQALFVTLAKNGQKGFMPEGCCDPCRAHGMLGRGTGFNSKYKEMWGLEPRTRVGSVEGKSLRGRSGGGGCSSKPATRSLEGRRGDRRSHGDSEGQGPRLDIAGGSDVGDAGCG